MWIKTVRFLLLGILLCMQGLACAAGGRLSLWEASSSRGTVYLFGSIHVCKANCFPLSSSVLSRFDASDSLVLELDPSRPEVQSTMLSAAMLPPGENLQQKLSASDWQALAKVLLELGLPPQVMAGFRPWMLGLAISIQAAQAAGFDATQGIDLWMLQRARELGKPLEELETAERQLAAISAGSEQEHLDALRLLVRQIQRGRLPAQLEEMILAWKQGDEARLEVLVREDMPKDSVIAREIIDRRNVEMSTRIVSMARNGRKLFVVVGAAHLLGRAGIPALLQKQGFRVRQLHEGE